MALAINKKSQTLVNPSSWSNVRKAVNGIILIWMSYYAQAQNQLNLSSENSI